MKLRPYQQEGYNDIFNAWETDPMLMYVCATGGGKTVTFVEAIRTVIKQGKRVYLVAHRKELIMQAWQTLYENEIMAGIIMNSYPAHFDRLAQVCSIQTLVGRKALPPADYLIFDEGHHAQADNSYGKIVSMFPDARCLMVTATPYRLGGEGFEFVHKYKRTRLIMNRTLRQLMDEGWLVPFRYMVASLPDLDQIKVKNGEYDEESAKKQMELAPLVESYFEHARGKSGVVFAVNVEASKQITRQYNEAGIRAAHLDAETPPHDRERIIREFKEKKILVIVNVGIVTEGTDFPDLEFVQLARPTKSLSMFLQMVGRGTRAIKGLLENSHSPEDRINRIKQSKKPYCIVLDNAGCYIDNGFPDEERDWPRFFKGIKKAEKKTDETMEILVYIAEDGEGNRYRTTNPKEIEGLKLIEVTHEYKKRIINIKSLKEFDKIYALLKRVQEIKKPGILSVNKYVTYCNKMNIDMTDEIWKYLYDVLVTGIEKEVEELELQRARSLEIFPDESFVAKINAIKARGVQRSWLKHRREEYLMSLTARQSF